MRIFVSASKHSYSQVPTIIDQLESVGHAVTPPNGFNEPEAEAQVQELSFEQYQDWKAEMIREDGRIVAAHDAVLVLNLEKHGQPNYIGGATFLEMFKAFDLDKKLFLFNPIPDGMLRDEIIGLKPIVINQDLALVK